MIDGFSHLVLHVTDLARSEAFYRDVFGLDAIGIGRDPAADGGSCSLPGTNSRPCVLLAQRREA